MGAKSTLAKGPRCMVKVQRFGSPNPGPGWDWRAQIDLEDRLMAALASVLPTLVRDHGRDYPGEFWAAGDYTLGLNDQDLADALGDALWAANGGFCRLSVYRYERGQHLGEAREIEPEPQVPANSLGLSELELDEIVGSFDTDDGPSHMARFIDLYLLTPAQRRILSEHGVLPIDLNNGQYPISLVPAIDAMFADWNQRMGKRFFGSAGIDGLIETIEDNLDADFDDDPDNEGLTFRPR